MNLACLDIGYGYLKYIDEHGSVNKVKAVVGLLGDSLTENDLKGIDVIEVDGENYIVGSAVYALSKKPITANENTGRANQIAYKVLGLYALAKMGFPSDEPIVVYTGLPFQNLDESDEVKQVFNGTHKIKLNKKTKKIEVAETKVVSQGLGSFYALVKQRGGGILSKKILLVDLGFRTINYMPLSNGDIDAEMVRTNRELGIQNAYIRIAEGVNRDYKTNYQFYNVDELLDQGVPRQDVEKGKVYEPITDKQYVQDALRDYANDVWNDISNKYPDSYLEDLDEVVFTGGTADRVQSYLNDARKFYCSFVENSQDVQVIGYSVISEKLERIKN